MNAKQPFAELLRRNLHAGLEHDACGGEAVRIAQPRQQGSRGGDDQPARARREAVQRARTGRRDFEMRLEAAEGIDLERGQRQHAPTEILVR